MTADADRHICYAFGEYRLEPARLRLTRRGRAVRIEPKAFRVLLVLVERAGSVVTKETLLDTVWNREFVGENVVSRAVAKLRSVLGDDPRTPRFVETVYTLGYRFVAAVERRGETALAVLPFVDLAEDPGQEFFADGLTESLIADLGGIRRLRVISRRSVLRYKDSPVPLLTVGAELGVDAVVEGSVLRAGDRVRISVQLVSVEPEQQLWSETFDGDRSDVLNLLGEVARAVAREVRIALAPDEHRRLQEPRPVDPEAYEDCLRGRFHWHGLAAGDLAVALKYFDRALARDPDLAMAHVGVADIWGSSGVWGIVPPDEALAKSLPALERALQLDDRVAEAHDVGARLRTYYDRDGGRRDWQAAESSHRRALDLRPSYAEGHLLYAVFLGVVGRLDEARRRLERGLAHDPYSRLGRAVQCWFLVAEARAEEAVALAAKEVGPNPSSAALPALWAGYERLGRFREALAAGRSFLAGLGQRGLLKAFGAPSDPESAYRSAMGRAADELAKRAGSTYVQPTQVGRTFLAAGRPERALEWLERAVAERDPFLTFLPMDTPWLALRDDARVQMALASLGLPQDSAAHGPAEGSSGQ